MQEKEHSPFLQFARIGLLEFGQRFIEYNTFLTEILVSNSTYGINQKQRN